MTTETEGPCERYWEAVAVVVTAQRGSTTLIQRTLYMGYNSAVRLVEKMERDGILGKPNHVGRREVLWQDMRRQPPAVNNIERLTSENEALRQALEFYGDEAAWNEPPVKTVNHEIFGKAYENQASKVRLDRGKIARAALSKKGEGE